MSWEGDRIDHARENGDIVKYSRAHDAYYNETKDYWISSKCYPCVEELPKGVDERMLCHFKCWERPDKPSQRRRINEQRSS